MGKWKRSGSSGVLVSRMGMKWGLALVLTASGLGTAQAASGSGQEAKPDFGPNVAVFNPSMPAAEMQAKIDKVYRVQEHNEFGPDRNAFLFLPGDYKVDVPVGFYTEVVGLGATPDAVHITGNVHSDASLPHNNATCTFWRAAEGFAVTPAGGPVNGTMQWAVSQAVPFRRMHVQGSMVLHQNGGWASGGWMSDSLVDGNVGAGPQQQWISRNSEWGSWTGANWNMVFVGVVHAPSGDWPQPPYTRVATTPVVREKPFLMVDAEGRYSVRVPALVRDSAGITWRGGATPGTSIPLSKFYIAHPGADSAATMNAQLDAGKNLLLTPGIYDLTEPIRVMRPDTVVMGLGFATLRPVKGTAAMTIADVDGVIVAGLLFDAGEQISPVLLEVGPAGSKASHAQNPISLHDVFFRVGGAGVGRAKVESARQQQRHHRRSHVDLACGSRRGRGLDSNLSDNGMVVNGDNVTVYGLFVEHHQQFQVLWNGQRRTHLFVSVRDSLRSAGSGELHKSARNKRLGLVQGGRCGHKP